LNGSTLSDTRILPHDVPGKQVFETRWSDMGLTKDKGRKLATQDYGSRLHVSCFKEACRRIQPLMLSIHGLRADAPVAHLENRDGTAKAGVGMEEAELARSQFKSLFAAYVSPFTKSMT